VEECLSGSRWPSGCTNAGYREIRKYVPAIVRKLRDACGHVPVVVLSADPQSLTEAREAHVSDYLPKPFDVGDLLALVDEHCD